MSEATMSQLNSSVSGLSDVEPGLGRIYLKGDAGDDHFSEEDNAVKTPMECECEADATKWLQSCASPDRSAADDGRMEMEPSIGAWHTFEDASICDSQLSDHDGEVVASPTSHATKPEGGEGLTAEGGDADDDEGGDGMDVEAGSVDGSQRHTLSKGADDDDRGGGGGGAEVAGYDKGDQEESSGQDDAPSQPPEPATDLHGDESGIKGSRRGRRRRRTGACSGDAEISGAGRSGDDGARNRKAGMDAAGDGGNNVLRSSCSSARVDGDGEVHNDQVLIAVHAGHEDTPSSSSLSAAAADQEDGTVDEEDAGNAHARQEEREEEEGQEEERGGKRGKRRSSGDEACGISEDESELPPERNELVSPFTMPTDYESGDEEDDEDEWEEEDDEDEEEDDEWVTESEWEVEDQNECSYEPINVAWSHRAGTASDRGQVTQAKGPGRDRQATASSAIRIMSNPALRPSDQTSPLLCPSHGHPHLHSNPTQQQRAFPRSGRPSTALSPPPRLASSANSRVSPLLRAATSPPMSSMTLPAPLSPLRAPSSSSFRSSPSISHRKSNSADENQDYHSEACSIDFEKLSDEARAGLLDELSCPICLSTLTEPLKLCCGHAFCRMCLHLSIRMSPDGRRCPMCRSVARPAKQKGALDALSASVDKKLDKKLRGLLPKGEYSRRQDQAKIRLEEAMGGGRSLMLPVYHMGNSAIQPGGFSHLHLFENRYKALIQRVIGGNRLFIYSKGPPRHGGVASIVLVTRCSILTGGKADVICRGIEKVTLSEVWLDREIHGMLMARCLSTVAAQLSDVIVNPEGDSGMPALMHVASPVSEELSSLLSVQGWLTQGQEGELVDLPVIGRPAGLPPIAIGDRFKLSLHEQRFRVVAQRLLSSPQLCLIGEEPPVSGQPSIVVLILQCRFKSNGSAKLVVQAIEHVMMLQVRHEDWAGRLYYARSRVSNEETRRTITAFRAALWAGGGNPPGIIDHLANEKKKGCVCCVS